MKTVAARGSIDDAIAELSIEAMAFLWRVHSGDARDVRATAEAHLRRLRALVRATGADLDASGAWITNTTTWRAIARLAGTDVRAASQAG
jgi:hypothetical protein